jgi:hypothetical protein
MAYTGSKAQAGRGTVVSIGGLTGGGGTTFTPILELKSSGISGSEWTEEDVSNFNSGANKEWLTTMLDSGTVDLAGNRITGDPGQQALAAAFDSGLKYDFKIQLPINSQAGQTTSGDLFTFSALVKSSETTIETTKAVTRNFKLHISGPITETAGS